MSSSVCLLPLVAALWTGSNLPELQNNPWQSINDVQARFMDTCYKPGVQDVTSNLLSPQELTSVASHNVSIVNQFLADNNFSIQLDDHGSDAIYLASILNVIIEWTKVANKTTLKGARDQKTYPAVSMSNKSSAQFQAVNTDHDRSIFMLKTKSGDTLYMTCAYKKDTPRENQIPLSGFDLVSYLMATSQKIEKQDCEFPDLDILTFPMIDYDETQNIDWLVGMGNGPWSIIQALQQTKFQMNERGAVVKSASAGAVARCLPEEYIINEPFYLWIKRPGVSLPIFAAYFDESSWKKPD